MILPSIHCVLIDDDFLVRKTWEMASKTAGLHIRTFATLSEFETLSASLNKDVKIFVDYRLEEGSGIEVTRTLFDRGFGNLYLATGMRECDLPPLSEIPWIKEIGGKEPYFIGGVSS